MNIERQVNLVRALLALSSIGLAFVFCIMLIALSGKDPGEALFWLFYGGFSPALIPETFIRATPLLFVSLGLAVAFSAKIWNIGAEGQLYIGGVVTATLALYISGAPSPIALPMLILVSGIAGALWALIPAILRAIYGINEVITTLMFNYIAIYFVSYLLNGPLRDPVSLFPETTTISSSLWLPIVVPGTRLHLGVILAFLIMTPIMWFFLKRTALGLKLEILGSGEKTAKYAGIESVRMIIIAMLISGFMAGMAGGVEVLGIQHKMRLEISPPTSPYGYTGIAVALLGYLNPLLIAATSFFLGGIMNGSTTMHRMVGVPVGMAGIIQAFIILFILLGYFLEEKFIHRIIGGLRKVEH